MGTNFSEVIDLALVTIQDYKIDKIYPNTHLFNSYMYGLLKRAIPLFTNCKVDLNYDEELGQFNSQLDIDEKNILANLLVRVWLEREINNITQITLRIGQGGDAKTYSEAQNLKEKREYHSQIVELCDHLMNVYGYKNIDFSSWANGSFGY